LCTQPGCRREHRNWVYYASTESGRKPIYVPQDLVPLRTGLVERGKALRKLTLSSRAMEVNSRA
jgi:hypothetical protein